MIAFWGEEGLLEGKLIHIKLISANEGIYFHMDEIHGLSNVKCNNYKNVWGTLNKKLVIARGREGRE